jgi:hypothetical protein
MIESLMALAGSFGVACLAFLALKAAARGGPSSASTKLRVAGWFALGASAVSWLVYADTVAIGVVTWSFCITPLAALVIVIGGAVQEVRGSRGGRKRDERPRR